MTREEFLLELLSVGARALPVKADRSIEENIRLLYANFLRAWGVHGVEVESDFRFGVLTVAFMRGGIVVQPELLYDLIVLN